MILDYAKSCEKRMLVSSLFIMFLGIVLLIEPTGSLNFITTIIALISTGIGVFLVVDYLKQSRAEKMMSVSLILGVVFIVIGIFLFVNISSLVNFITTLIGITIVVKSLFKLQFAFNLKGISSAWVYNLGFGIASLVIGITLIVNPFGSAELFLRIVGVLLILSSIAEIIENVKVMHSLDDVKELPFVEKKKESKEEEKDQDDEEGKGKSKKGRKHKDID